MAVTDNYPAKLTNGYYRVRETWEDAASQVGAFRILANAIAKCDDNPGTYVFDDDGNAIYPEEETGTEEESGLEEETGIEDDTESETADDTEPGGEDTENDADDGVTTVSDAADETVDDGDTTDGGTEGNTSDEGVTAGGTTEDASDGKDTVEDEDAGDDAGTDDAIETDGDTEADAGTDTDADDSGEEFPEAEEDPVAYGKLKTLMNIRVEPSLEAEILTTYAKGTIVSVLEVLDSGWLKIICDAADEGHAYVSNEEGEYVYVGASLYTVKSGDTLWKIAESQLGDGTLYKEIRTLNGLTSNTIKVGMQLILP